MEQQAIRKTGEKLHEDIQQWKKATPDWEACLKIKASPHDSEREKQLRHEFYKELAAFPIAGLQRLLNEKRLPHNPDQGHWEKWAISEMQTMQQHSRGQYLPFHEQMENALAHLLEVVDGTIGYKAADKGIHVKNIIEHWFNNHIRQPAQAAWKKVSQQQQRRTY